MNRNPFELLGLPNEYNLIEGDIEKAYKGRMKQFHPDLYALKTKKEQLMATQISSLIVDAYHTLKDPVKRGVSLLNILGFSFDLNNAGNLDPEVIFEQITIREELDNAKRNNDTTAVINKIIKIKDSLIENTAVAFFKKDYQRVKSNLISMQFYSKILETERSFN